MRGLPTPPSLSFPSHISSHWKTSYLNNLISYKDPLSNKNSRMTDYTGVCHCGNVEWTAKVNKEHILWYEFDSSYAFSNFH